MAIVHELTADGDIFNIILTRDWTDGGECDDAAGTWVRGKFSVRQWTEARQPRRWAGMDRDVTGVFGSFLLYVVIAGGTMAGRRIKTRSVDMDYGGRGHLIEVARSNGRMVEWSWCAGAAQTGGRGCGEHERLVSVSVGARRLPLLLEGLVEGRGPLFSLGPTQSCPRAHSSSTQTQLRELHARSQSTASTSTSTSPSSPQNTPGITPALPVFACTATQSATACPPPPSSRASQLL